LQQVIYKESTQEGLLQTLIADGLPQLNTPEFTERFESLTPRGQAANLLFFSRTWHYMAMIDIVRFKHPSFEVEQEWRLVAQPQPHFNPDKIDEHEVVKFRPLRGIPTPYLILKPKDNIHHIRCIRWGPTLEKKRVEHAISLLLRENDYGKIPLYGSDIPVRL